jgi:hypothetical protein
MWAAIFVSALVLFAVGAYKARLTVGHPGRSGLEMAIIGTVSALVGSGIGVLQLSGHAIGAGADALLDDCRHVRQHILGAGGLEHVLERIQARRIWRVFSSRMARQQQNRWSRLERSRLSGDLQAADPGQLARSNRSKVC